VNWIMVIAGALLGAPLRYLTDKAVQVNHDTVFPWGTLAVNVAACTGLGFLTGATAAVAVPASLQHLIGPGLCATLSTYSTFSFETIQLAENGSKLYATANAAVSIITGLGTAYIGGAIATATLL
jgi:CrcB protein